jgi:hypothetical protein
VGLKPQRSHPLGAIAQFMGKWPEEEPCPRPIRATAVPEVDVPLLRAAVRFVEALAGPTLVTAHTARQSGPSRWPGRRGSSTGWGRGLEEFALTVQAGYRGM